MHSVVVFGDVRTHLLLESPSSKPSTSDSSTATLLGGAYYMAAAVADAVSNIDGPGPEVFSYKASSGAAEGDFKTWDLIHREGMGASRLRLKLRSHGAPIQGYPQPADDFKAALRKGGLFEPARGMNLPECPDIVIFDDLNLFLRASQLNVALDTLAGIDELLSDASGEQEVFNACLAALLARLIQAAKRHTEANRIGLEPVILCSIASGVPELKEAQENYLSVLAGNKWLRERTIIMLDAADLREHHQMAISSGLSWERTAQDTISELRRVPLLSQLLSFGQLIVRYGVSGALHVVNREGRDPTYTLFFDPSLDDTAFTDPDRDGVVLGATSVYAASVVQSLSRVCNLRGEQPVVYDLAASVADTLPTAIRRCQYLTEKAYGRSILETLKLSDDDYLPSGLFDITPSWPINSYPGIGQVTVPPSLKTWSIATQSTQVNIGSIASEIVRFGPNYVLNQPTVSPSLLETALTEKLLDAAIHRVYELFDVWAGRFENAADFAISEARDGVLGNEHFYGKRSADARRATIAPQSEEWSYIRQDIIAFFKWSFELAKVHSIARKAQFEGRAWGQPFSRLQSALKRRVGAIVSSGLQPHWKCAPVVAPIVRFGRSPSGDTDRRLVVIDRSEIEGFRSLEKLVKAHLESVAEERCLRPLSVGIFGPPGAGKSSAVRHIVEGLQHKTQTSSLTFNLAQFTGSESLDRAFDQVVNEIALRRIPVVFFDEFDSRLNQDQLGWLKFFLAPMEDGVYKDKTVKNAIFVFAGGTSATFADFSMENRSTTDPQWQDFSRAKGPDFASRLQGYLNIMGINPSDSNDELYMIRRAILIRSMLTFLQGLSDDEEARIDNDVLRAVLNVPSYKHGGRSVRMLLERCSVNSGERSRLSKGSVPAIHQLNMMVDGKAFLDLIANVSSMRPASQ